MIDDPARLDRAAALIAAYAARGWTIVTAESCTGGLVAGLLTAVPGSSAVLERGYVTYSNAAKTEAIGVDPGLIAAYGAVSGPVARAMAEGALAASGADVAVAVTGIAGPGGGTAEKPVGLVWFGLARRDGASEAHQAHFGPHASRSAIRIRAVERTLSLLEGVLARP